MKFYICARCEHSFLACVAECPKCGFGCYEFERVVSPNQVCFGSFRFATQGKKYVGFYNLKGFENESSSGK